MPPPQGQTRIAFFHVHSFDGSSHRAAMLITDGDTHPLEFRCTSPVQPTKIQHLLYGGILREHIFVKLLAEPLLRSAREKPNLILVREPELLELRPLVECPVLRVGRVSEAGSVATGDPRRQIVEGDADKKFEAIVVETHKNHTEDRQNVQHHMAELLRRRDLLEPFQRAAAALELVHKENPTS